MHVYLAACERHGRSPGRLVVFIADDYAYEVSVGQALIDAGYRGGRSAESVAFGGVDRVAAQLSTFAELGFDDVIIRTMKGIGQEKAVRSIELAGDVARQLSS